MQIAAAMPQFALAEGVATKRDRFMLIQWMTAFYHTGLRTDVARGLR